MLLDVLCISDPGGFVAPGGLFPLGSLSSWVSLILEVSLPLGVSLILSVSSLRSWFWMSVSSWVPLILEVLLHVSDPGEIHLVRNRVHCSVRCDGSIVVFMFPKAMSIVYTFRFRWVQWDPKKESLLFSALIVSQSLELVVVLLWGASFSGVSLSVGVLLRGRWDSVEGGLASLQEVCSDSLFAILPRGRISQSARRPGKSLSGS